MKRIAGLDTVRLFCALTVIFFHQTSPPLPFFLSRDTPLGRILLGLYDAAFNGQAAVIAFFVISGFCIHWPFASGYPFVTGRFLLGRLVRILIPTGAYLFLLRVVPYHTPELTLLLWSIWCELIYYGLYPLLRSAFAKTSVGWIVLASYGVSLIPTLPTVTGPNWSGLFSAGSWTWLAGLPCWLLGCLLADRLSKVATPRPVTRPALWCYRLGAAALGSACYLAMLHLHISFLISLQGFAVFTYFWIGAEVRWHLHHRANPLLERLGSLSFSIYLMHMLGKSVWESFAPTHGVLPWAGEISFILGFSAIFYALVERPSHLLARMLSRSPSQSFSAAVIGDLRWKQDRVR